MSESPDPAFLNFPRELEIASYRTMHPDLASMSDEALLRHFQDHGRSEGRRGNNIGERGDFVALIPGSARVLEIGPFCAPMVRGDNVRYFDVLDEAGLERRAEKTGYPHRRAPHIDFVSPNGDLSIVDEHFDFVVSSHCIEHQPDLIAHLKLVSKILTDGGRYFLLIPDKRYCFDAFLPESNIAEVIDAHCQGRNIHTLRRVIEHRALTTHNDCEQHWAGQHGAAHSGVNERVASALSEFEEAAGGYIDVHAWQFTPASLEALVPLLVRQGYIDLDVERMYSTRRNRNEFWCILGKMGRQE